jgi:predicted dehydrogenase
MKKLRVAVIGTGFIGPVHAEAVRRNPDLAELVAIAGSSEEAAGEAAASLNVPFHSGDYRNVLDRDDVDLVHICTPNYLHYPMVRDCFENGKHVLCEKPLAMTSGEARDLLRLAEEKGLKAAVNYNLRYYPMIQEIKSRNGTSPDGRIFALQGSYLQDWLLHETDYSWRMESKLSGKTRAVADIGTHWMDLAQYVTGLKIEKVLAQFGRMFETRRKAAGGRDHSFDRGGAKKSSDYTSYPVDTEDHAQILLSFEGGVLGNLTLSQVSAGYKNFMEYRQMGRDVSYSWNSEAPNRVTIGHRDQANEVLMKDPGLLNPRAASMSAYPGGHQEGYGDTLKFILREFYSDVLGSSVEGGACDYPTLRDGLSEMLLCEAILQSAETGAWVEVGK